MSHLHQPIFTNIPEIEKPGCAPLSLSQFINLVKEEEDYWPGDELNTPLMVTRLRKIFYDQWGWDDRLITGAAHIPNRYKVEILDQPDSQTKKLRWRKTDAQKPKFRKVTYTATDRVHADKAGQVPTIYDCNHQEVILPTGECCDIGHVLAGLDAYNNPQVVVPFPKLWNLLKIGPHVDNNEDIVTWLGDIASTSADFFFYYLRHGSNPITLHQQQTYINADAPGSDMLGNIDAFVIARHYNLSAKNEQRVSDILHQYFIGTDYNPPFRTRRISFFCGAIGLEDWNGTNFKNEADWLRSYTQQLKDNVCFQAYSIMEPNAKTYWQLLKIYMGLYKGVLQKEELLKLWLKALKQEINKETFVYRSDWQTAGTFVIP